MNCGCRKVVDVETPSYIQILARKHADTERKTVCIIFCTDWDICTLETIGNRKIIEIITPNEI